MSWIILNVDLRLRGHPFRLPGYCTDLRKKSFIVRLLYEYIKWYCIGIMLLTSCFIVSYVVCFLYYRCTLLYCCTMCVCRILIKITYLLIYLRLSCTETSWPYNRLKYRIHRYPSQVLSSSAVNSIIRRAFQVLFVCCLVVVLVLLLSMWMVRPSVRC